jgi:hypothetical protein
MLCFNKYSYEFPNDKNKNIWNDNWNCGYKIRFTHWKCLNIEFRKAEVKIVRKVWLQNEKQCLMFVYKLYVEVLTILNVSYSHINIKFWVIFQYDIYEGWSKNSWTPCIKQKVIKQITWNSSILLSAHMSANSQKIVKIVQELTILHQFIHIDMTKRSAAHDVTNDVMLS